VICPEAYQAEVLVVYVSSLKLQDPPPIKM
jgi:hypothetical protein